MKKYILLVILVAISFVTYADSFSLNYGIGVILNDNVKERESRFIQKNIYTGKINDSSTIFGRTKESDFRSELNAEILKSLGSNVEIGGYLGISGLSVNHETANIFPVGVVLRYNSSNNIFAKLKIGPSFVLEKNYSDLKISTDKLGFAYTLGMGVEYSGIQLQIAYKNATYYVRYAETIDSEDYSKTCLDYFTFHDSFLELTVGYRFQM